MTKPRVAIVGGGISGIYAAYLLQDSAEVQIFESTAALGGHAYTHTEGVSSPCDMGFVIFNELYYPLFSQFLRDLKVFDATNFTPMSFAYESDHNAYWLAKLTWRNLVKMLKAKVLARSLWIMLRLLSKMPAIKKAGAVNLNIRSLVGNALFSELFRPLLEIIWSLPENAIDKMPSSFILNYFKQHGLLKHDGAGKGRWRSFPFGSKTYIDAFRETFRGKIHLSTAVHTIEDCGDKVQLRTGDLSQEFDFVVLATHADVSLKLLKRPTDLQRDLLGAVSYHPKQVYLHSDKSLLPHMPAAWNVKHTKQHDAVSYDMSKIHSPLHASDYVVSWGTSKPGSCVTEQSFEHPNYTPEFEANRANLGMLNEQGRVTFCGAYFGYGFHEDGCWSAKQAVTKLGIRVPEL